VLTFNAAGGMKSMQRQCFNEEIISI